MQALRLRNPSYLLYKEVVCNWHLSQWVRVPFMLLVSIVNETDGQKPAEVKLMKSSIFSYEQAWHRYRSTFSMFNCCFVLIFCSNRSVMMELTSWTILRIMSLSWIVFLVRSCFVTFGKRGVEVVFLDIPSIVVTLINLHCEGQQRSVRFSLSLN